jgi:hypothetical protein
VTASSAGTGQAAPSHGTGQAAPSQGTASSGAINLRQAVSAQGTARSVATNSRQAASSQGTGLLVAADSRQAVSAQGTARSVATNARLAVSAGGNAVSQRRDRLLAVPGEGAASQRLLAIRKEATAPVVDRKRRRLPVPAEEAELSIPSTQQDPAVQRNSSWRHEFSTQQSANASYSQSDPLYNNSQRGTGGKFAPALRLPDDRDIVDDADEGPSSQQPRRSTPAIFSDALPVGLFLPSPVASLTVVRFVDSMRQKKPGTAVSLIQQAPILLFPTAKAPLAAHPPLFLPARTPTTQHPE